MYRIESYGSTRFSAEYAKIYEFLLKVADSGYNEHFHWGRFEWMMSHTLLDEDKLDTIAVVKDAGGQIAGLITFDTCYEDRSYLLHSSGDKELLRTMLDYVIKGEKDNPTIMVNSMDKELCQVLQAYQFVKRNKMDNVLQLNLQHELHYTIPGAYSMSPLDFEYDHWKYQLVLHKGFNHKGIPKLWESRFFKPSPNEDKRLRVFAMNKEDYCAHCGVWYTQGETAYIEPVATIPKCRKQGLAKAVVYEALNRARKLGAKRAVVLSEKEFYGRLGFEPSSEFYAWVKEK